MGYVHRFPNGEKREHHHAPLRAPSEITDLFPSFVILGRDVLIKDFDRFISFGILRAELVSKRRRERRGRESR